jgi:hypothetical protein
VESGCGLRCPLLKSFPFWKYLNFLIGGRISLQKIAKKIHGLNFCAYRLYPVTLKEVLRPIFERRAVLCITTQYCTVIDKANTGELGLENQIIGN